MVPTRLGSENLDEQGLEVEVEVEGPVIASFAEEHISGPLQSGRFQKAFVVMVVPGALGLT